MSPRCQNTGVPAFLRSGKNDRRQRADRGSCFTLQFLQIVAVTVPLQFGEYPENTPRLQSHENARQLLSAEIISLLSQTATTEPVISSTA